MTYQEQFFRLMIWIVYGAIGLVALCGIALVLIAIIEQLQGYKVARHIKRIEREIEEERKNEQRN